MINKTDRISVYNTNPFSVSASTHLNEKGYFWGFTNNPKQPTMQVMGMDEVEYIYNNGNAIQNGYLTFRPEQQEEIYKTLGFTNWKDVLTIDEIEDLLLNPDADKAQRVIDIDSMARFERVRAVMIGLISTKQYDISNRIMLVVNERYKEWLRGQSKSDIIIRTADVQVEKVEDVDSLKNELEQMKEMMAQLMKQNQVDSSKSDKEDVSEDKPKRGRKTKEQVEEK